MMVGRTTKMGECNHTSRCIEYTPGDPVCDNWGGRIGRFRLEKCRWYADNTACERAETARAKAETARQEAIDAFLNPDG